MKFFINLPGRSLLLAVKGNSANWSGLKYCQKEFRISFTAEHKYAWHKEWLDLNTERFYLSH